MSKLENVIEIIKIEHKKVFEELVYYANNINKHVKELCYCVFEDFFDKNGIIVIPDYSVEDNEYYYSIYKSQYCVASTFEHGFMFDTKPEAKQAAILKACEILEEKLSKG